MSAHVLLNLLNELGGKEIKCEACRAFYLVFATILINSIIQEHECYTLRLFYNLINAVKSYNFVIMYAKLLWTS